MKTFSEKLKQLRKERGLKQTEFGELIGVTNRMIVEYEKGTRKPHRKKMQEFADVLEVPIEYLTDDSVEDIVSVFNENNSNTVVSDTETSVKSEISQSEIEAQAMREVEFLKERSAALFAGGELPQESKDAFFHSLYTAYLKCREQAVEKNVDVDKFGY
jgi:transcriptional regulator with XRE-family HTH domain